MATVLDLAYAASNVYENGNIGAYVKDVEGGRLKRGQFRNNLGKWQRNAIRTDDSLTRFIRRSSTAEVLRTYGMSHMEQKVLREMYSHDTQEEQEDCLRWFVINNRTARAVRDHVQTSGMEEDGMYAATYVVPGSGAKVIAFRGSELTWTDWHFNARLFTEYKTQFKSALKFATKVCEVNKWDPTEVYLTGHSLGGALASFVAFCWTRAGRPPKCSITFNSPQLQPGPVTFLLTGAIGIFETLIGRGWLWGQSTMLDLDRPVDKKDLGISVGINILSDQISPLGSAVAPQVNLIPNPLTESGIPILGSHSLANVISMLTNSKKTIGTADAFQYAKEQNGR